MNQSISYHDLKLKRLQDHDYAQLYLETSLEDMRQDGNRESFLLALRDVAEAQSGIPDIAEKMDVPKQTLYHALSQEGNPRLETLMSLLETLGFRLSVQSIQ